MPSSSKSDCNRQHGTPELYLFVTIYYTFQQYNTRSTIGNEVRWKRGFLGETRQALREYSESNPSINQWGPDRTMLRDMWCPGLHLKRLTQCKVYSTMLIFCLHKLCLSQFIPHLIIMLQFKRPNLLVGVQTAKSTLHSRNGRPCPIN